MTNNRKFNRKLLSVYTEKFTVKLLITEDLKFVIHTLTPDNPAVTRRSLYSESFNSYETASTMFDLKVKDLNAVYP